MTINKRRIFASASFLLLVLWSSISALRLNSVAAEAVPFKEELQEAIDMATLTSTKVEKQANVLAADLGLPAIPEKFRDILPVDGATGNLLQLKACTEDGEVPEDYVPPYTSEEMCDDYFTEKFGSVDTALATYQPSTVLVVGGSVGIGRANACYWAARGKKVISLATRPVHLVGQNEATAIDCEFSKNIINYQFDITDPPEKQRRLSSILRENDIESIDLLYLNAGRAMFGDLRDYTSRDLIGAYMNNVFGLHDVWVQARIFLNPDLAVVFGMSSRLAESRFLAKSDVYSLTKRAVYDLLLSYAQQEEFVQPNTHYAAIVQGAAQSSVSLNYFAPSSNANCWEYKVFGLFSNTLNNIGGLKINELALKFHKAYARIAAAADTTMNADFDRADIPQSFGWSPPENWGRIEEIWYNSRILFPEEVSACYGESWDDATTFLLDGCPDAETGKSSCPLGVGEIFIPFIDPRKPFKCSAV